MNSVLSSHPLDGRKVLIFYNYKDNPKETNKHLYVEDALIMQCELNNHSIQTEIVPIYKDIETPLKNYNPNDVIVFNWCEEFGDNPKGHYIVTEYFEKYGFIYTGNTPDVLELSNDKSLIKKILVKKGVFTPEYKICKSSRGLESWNMFPAIVKPSGEHSSQGITKDSVVENIEQLKCAVDLVVEKYECAALVERFIDGCELFMSVIGNENEVEVLPFWLADYKNFDDLGLQTYSYNSKTVPGSEEYEKLIIREPYEGEYSREVLSRINEEVTKAFRVLNSRGFVRFDVRINGGIPYILDFNPNPDITSECEITWCAQRAGYSYADLIIKICRLALDDYANVLVGKNHSAHSFMSNRPTT